MSSMAKDTEIRIAVQRKAQAVRAGVLQPLWCEDVLGAGVQEPSACLGAYDESVVRHVSLVRAVRGVVQVAEHHKL